MVEFFHFLSFLIILAATIDDLINAQYYQALKATGINIVVNVLPIFVQRYNRIRILRIFKLTYKDVKGFNIEL